MMATMTWRDAHRMPERAEARASSRKGKPICGSCGGHLQHGEQDRCPYVACRKWLKGMTDYPELNGPKVRTLDDE